MLVLSILLLKHNNNKRKVYPSRFFAYRHEYYYNFHFTDEETVLGSGKYIVQCCAIAVKVEAVSRPQAVQSSNLYDRLQS